MSDDDALATKAAELSAKVRPLLAGQQPQVVGAVLADLLSIFLAGHVVLGDREVTEQTQNALLEVHIEGVREMLDHENDEHAKEGWFAGRTR